MATLACRADAPGAGPAIAEEVEALASATPGAMSLVRHQETSITPHIDWAAASVARAPMSLTAGDGTGLRLVSVTGTMVIEDPLAFTELHLTFENPERRRREGRFEIDLPPDAALSRLAMRIGGRWMEGEVIERQRARETFESYIHFRPKVDPALLEQAAANRVSARVFPIAPNERKQIIVSYSQPLNLGEDRNIRLPLHGLPALDELDLNVVVKTVEGPGEAATVQRVVEVHERDFTPDRDLIVTLDGAGDSGAVRADELVAVRVRPQALELDDHLDGLTILFDTSASSAHGFDVELDRLAGLLASLDQRPVRILAFDQDVALIHEGAAKASAGPAVAGLRARRALGASNLEAALDHELVRAAPARRLLIWSDGVATAGAGGREILSERASALHLERIDAYASTATADRERLTALATTGARAGVVVGPELGGAAILAYLEGGSFDGVAVAVEGADWSYPHTLEGFAPGDDVVVFASFPETAPDQVRVSFSDPRLPAHEVPTLAGAAPLIVRSVARARVKQLQLELERSANPDEAEAIRSHLIELAVDNRLLTKHTALLVLENEDEYRRHRIHRAAKADILTADAAGIGVVRRGKGPKRRPQAPVDFGVVAAAAASDDADVNGEDNQDESEDESGAGGERVAGGGGMPFSGNGVRATQAASAPAQLRRNFDPDAARNGILGVMQQQQQQELFAAEPSPLADAFAVGGGSEVWGQLSGTEVGEAYGVGGLGLVGTGRGGGGTGEGTIGLGNIGLIGHGGGGGTGSGYGRGSGASFGGRGRPVPQVRQAKAMVNGAISPDIIRRIVRAHINEVRSCYNAGLTRNPELRGRVEINFAIGGAGRVLSSVIESSTLSDGGTVSNCIAAAVRRWAFPKPPGGGTVTVRYPFELDPGSTSSNFEAIAHWGGRRSWRPARRPGDPSEVDAARWSGSAQSGEFGRLRALVDSGSREQALALAWAWVAREPDNSLAFVALGELLEVDERPDLAARVYGSLIDLHPQRADMRRSAGARLERLGPDARALALDSYRKAIEQRPDQINGHRLLAWALAKDGAHEEAFEVLGQALEVRLPAARYNGVKGLLRDDRRLVAAAWLAANGGGDSAIEARLREAGVSPDPGASLRVVASWETDSTDVDIIVTPIGPGDGRRHADVRTGFGPEAWIARDRQVPRAVSARVRYFNRGAMGYAMGTVSVVTHDGAGHLRFEDSPFVLMNASGSEELGRFES